MIPSTMGIQNIKIGAELFHWRFGPMTITSIDESNLYVIINHPTGLVKTELERIPKKFNKKYVGQFLFLNPSDALKTPKIAKAYLHKFYTSSNNGIDSLKKKERIQKRISEIKNEIEKHNETLESKRNELSIISKIIDPLEKDKNALLEELKRKNEELKFVEAEIMRINNTRSPRELKVLLPKIPELEKTRLDLNDKLEKFKNRRDEISRKLHPITLEREKLQEQISFLNSQRDSLSLEEKDLNHKVAML